MTLLEGETLWNLAWILPLIAILFYWSCRKRNRVLRSFLGKRADDPECVNSSPVRRFWRGLIFAGILILLIAAAARPSWGVRILPYSGQGRDLMVVFDVSKSMLAQDVRPSRLEHAKWLVRQLCTRNPGDRFGLIAFAGNAFLECPLTIDQTSFLQSVDELSVDSIPVGGTNIQQALTEAIRGFQAAETPHRAVILITDGDELTGSGAKALDRIVKLKIPLFILGIGDPAQPAIVQVPDGKGGIQTLKDRSGNVVSVPLNEKMLAGLARETGGIYVRSTTTNPGLDQIEARIKKLEKHGIDSGKQTRPIERPLYPLLGAFILFCLWLMLGERSGRTVQQKSVKLILLCALAGLFFNVSAQDAPGAMKQNAPAEPDPEIQTEKLSPEEFYNRGLKAQTQEKDAKKAVQLYEQAIAAVHSAPEVRSRSAQNLGVMNHQKARALFQQALQSVQTQQLDPALQQTDAALKQLAGTEEIYKDALREGGNTRSIAGNQHQLIQDRMKAEELKKKIEELKKKQQEARKNTQQAMNQQQKQNQQQQKRDQQNQKQDQNQQQKNQQSGKDQQKQDQQSGKDQQKPNQQQKQDQQSGKDQQKPNQQQTDKARESVRQLQQQAKDLNQKKLEDQAKKAGEELDKARQAQDQNRNQDAEKHLKNALDQLGKDQQNQKQDQKQQQKNQQSGKDQQKDQKQDRKDQKKDQKQDKQLPKPGEAQKQPAKPEPEKDIDKDQAKALLDLMAGDEKKLKDELKARMKRNYGVRPVDKDW